MPPFHLMSDSLHDHGDTLTQLKLEIKSMQEKEDNANESVNDWVSYVDDKQSKFFSASDWIDEKESSPEFWNSCMENMKKYKW